MIHLIQIVTFLLLFVYNFMLFHYAQTVFLQKLSWKKNYLYTSLINVPLFALFHIFTIHIFIVMLLVFVVIMVEIQLLYKEHWQKSLFFTFCFTVIFFAIRLFYSSVYSIVKSVPISYSLLDEKVLLLMTIFTILTLIPFITVFRIYFPSHMVNMVSSDETVLFCANKVIGALYVYLIINTFTLYSDTFGQLMQWLCIIISIFALIGFGTTILYAYLYSNRMLFKKRSYEIKTLLEESQQEYDEIQYAANHDSLTNCYTRTFAMNALEKAIHNNNKFCVIYFDIDGLKFTNDTFGHSEGDWYIQQVANVLQNVFKSHIVCRMGGDEFIAILERRDVYFAMRFAVRSFETVEALSLFHKKPFLTSVSYGVISCEKETTLPVEEIINLADKRMYEFKKLRRKNRHR